MPGETLSACKAFLSLIHTSWFAFDIFLKGRFVTLGKLSSGKVHLNVLCACAMRGYEQYFRYISVFFYHEYSHQKGQ